MIVTFSGVQTSASKINHHYYGSPTGKNETLIHVIQRVVIPSSACLVLMRKVSK